MKLNEKQARILALRIAASFPNREASTAQIKKAIPRFVTLTDADLTPSQSRANEEKWQQIVGNVISHKNSATSIFAKGHAERIRGGIRVTDAGAKFLEDLP